MWYCPSYSVIAQQSNDQHMDPEDETYCKLFFTGPSHGIKSLVNRFLETNRYTVQNFNCLAITKVTSSDVIFISAQIPFRKKITHSYLSKFYGDKLQLMQELLLRSSQITIIAPLLIAKKDPRLVELQSKFKKKFLNCLPEKKVKILDSKSTLLYYCKQRVNYQIHRILRKFIRSFVRSNFNQIHLGNFSLDPTLAEIVEKKWHL